MTTGLSIPEINNLVDNGATISDDGNIQLPTIKPAEESTESEEEKSTVSTSSDESTSGESEASTKPEVNEQTKEPFPIVAAICILVCVIVVVCVIVKVKKRKRPIEATVDHHDDEGGVAK